MAIVVPIVTEYTDKGMQAALRNIKNAEGPMNKLTAATALLGPALATAGIAAGAFAVKLGVDGVKAAIAEEAEITKLAAALGNLGFGEQTKAVEDWISAQAKATTFSDSNLRPSLALLAGATKDVTAAQDLLTLAMDISVGTGKDLDTVSAGLAKAYAGNTGALKRLIPGLTDADLASQDLFTSTGALADRFSGQATSAAQTWEGQLGNVTEAFGELQEAFGAGFLKGLGEAEGGTGDLTTAIYDMQPVLEETGKALGEFAATLASLFKDIVALKKAWDDFRATLEGTPWGKIVDTIALAFERLTSPLKALQIAIEGVKSAIDALRNIQLPSFNLPSVSSVTGASAASTRNAAPTYNITVTGAIDPVGVSRQIKRILATGDMRSGRGA